MSVADIYGSGGSFLKAADLPAGQMFPVYIAEVTVKDTNFNNTPGKQLVLTLYGQDKQFGLNKTQATAIEKLYGPDPFKQWVNQGLYLGPHEVTFNGNKTQTILVYPTPLAMTQEQYQQGQAWLQQRKAEQAAAAAQAQMTPAFSGPPTAPPPAANAFAAPPPAPVEQAGQQFTPPAPGAFGGNPFQS